MTHCNERSIPRVFQYLRHFLVSKYWEICHFPNSSLSKSKEHPTLRFMFMGWLSVEFLLLEACWLWSYNKITLKKYIAYYMRWINFYSDGNEVLEGTRVSFSTWEEVICWSGLFIVYQAEHWREDAHIPCWVCVENRRSHALHMKTGHVSGGSFPVKEIAFVGLWCAGLNARKLGERTGRLPKCVLQGCLWMVICLYHLPRISISGLTKHHGLLSRERTELVLISILLLWQSTWAAPFIREERFILAPGFRLW